MVATVMMCSGCEIAMADGFAGVVAGGDKRVTGEKMESFNRDKLQLGFGGSL
jgi:hypothetical protein